MSISTLLELLVGNIRDRAILDVRGRTASGIDNDRRFAIQADQIAAARSLIAQGVSEVMVVSLGAKGALLVSAQEAEWLAPIAVPIRSAVGAGDSMVGAIVFGLTRGLDLHHAVRLGMAAGAATLMTPGTELCQREDVERLYEASTEGRSSDDRLEVVSEAQRSSRRS